MAIRRGNIEQQNWLLGQCLWVTATLIMVLQQLHATYNLASGSQHQLPVSLKDSQDHPSSDLESIWHGFSGARVRMALASHFFFTHLVESTLENTTSFN